jgi:UDP-N-acetylmuramate dehydrogenase
MHLQSSNCPQIENVCVSMPDLASTPRLIVGGGSNLVVLEPEFDGVVLRPEIQCFKPVQTGDDVYLEVGAGHSWHHTVMQTLNEGWFGLENLALIPGWMGACTGTEYRCLRR